MMKDFLPSISYVSVHIHPKPGKLPKNFVFSHFSLHIATKGVGVFSYQLPDPAHSAVECADVFIAFLPPGTRVNVEASEDERDVEYTVFEFDSNNFRFNPEKRRMETTLPDGKCQSISLHLQFPMADRSVAKLYEFAVAGMFGWGTDPSERTDECAVWILPMLILKLFELDKGDHVSRIDPLLVMEARLRNDIRLECSMEQIVEGLGDPRRVLIDRFKRKFGVSPFSFRHYERVKKIVAEINDTEKSFSEIAAAYGFSNVSCLTTMIKKATGMTPSEMRQVSRNDRWRKLFSMPKAGRPQ